MVARDAGWEIVAVEPQEGRLEATATSLLFGFKDDIVIRVTPHERGSQLDIRSMSRVGRSDVGVNARRMRRFLTRLKTAIARHAGHGAGQPSARQGARWAAASTPSPWCGRCSHIQDVGTLP
jgi:hypothetical protein